MISIFLSWETCLEVPEDRSKKSYVEGINYMIDTGL